MSNYTDTPSLDDNTMVISTQRLTKAFGSLVAVNDLNLQVMRGDVFGFLGPNGSGKTTTIRMLLGLIRPTAGRALLFDMDNAYQRQTILQRVGAIVETPTFYPYLSGIDNLRVMAANSGMLLGEANEPRYEEILTIVDLAPYAKLAYRKYSLGMKQRLGIAAALLTDPELVMLDEPTNGLDPAGVIEIRNLILRLAGLGKTIFLSSHILSEVQQVCNKVAIMRKGNLVKQGSVRDLLRTREQIAIRFSEGNETESAIALFNRLREQDLPWIAQVAVEADTYKQSLLVLDAPVARSSEINRLLAQNDLFAAEIHPRAGSLEAVYMQATATPTMGGDSLDTNNPAHTLAPSEAEQSIDADAATEAEQSIDTTATTAEIEKGVAQ